MQTLNSHAILNRSALTGQHTVGGYPVVVQTNHCTPAFYSTGRYIELDVQVNAEARLDVHSCDSDTTGMDYDARIVCNYGLPNDVGGGTLSL